MDTPGLDIYTLDIYSHTTRESNVINNVMFIDNIYLCRPKNSRSAHRQGSMGDE